MNITRWPDLLRLDPFDDNWPPLLRAPGSPAAPGAPQMRLDVSEQDGHYRIKAEIPGARKEDIDVRLDGREVCLSAEVRRERDDEPAQADGARTLRSERYYGFVSRRFSLADEVDEDKAQARYEDGVLELTLPKKAMSATRRVAIG